MDITKPLCRFVTVAEAGGQSDIWVRLGYECPPTFCYECGMIGHSEMECEKDPVDIKDINNLLNLYAVIILIL